MLTFTLNINIKLPLFWSTLSRAGGLDLAISVGLAHGLCVLLLKGLGHCFPLNCWKYWKKIGQPRDIPTLIPQDDSYMNSYMNSWCLRIHISIYALEFMIMKSYMNLYHKFIKLKSIWSLLGMCFSEWNYLLIQRNNEPFFAVSWLSSLPGSASPEAAVHSVQQLLWGNRHLHCCDSVLEVDAFDLSKSTWRFL